MGKVGYGHPGYAGYFCGTIYWCVATGKIFLLLACYFYLYFAKPLFKKILEIVGHW